MAVESQMMANPNLNFIPDAVFLDIFSQPSYTIGQYKKPDHEDLNMLNNNMNKSEVKLGTVDVINQNLLNLRIMPPPPHKMVNYNNNNNTVKRYQPRDNTRSRDNYRPISPKGYDSDESCTSYSSRGTPTDNRLKYYNTSRCGVNKLNDQNVVFGKYSQSTPNVYHTNVQYTSNIQNGTHNNGHYNKTRSYTNSNGTTNASTNGRQKHNVHHKNSMDSMIKRAHGLVERFRSKSNLMRIDPNPPGLLNGGPWDQLNQTVWDVFTSKAQKEDTYESKISLWKNIFLNIRKCLSSYGLFMVGSTMSGFGLESSDIDMCLLTKPCTNDPRHDALQHLESIKNLLLKNELTDVDPELIYAKVPILKFKDKDTGFEIDLNCNNSVGIRNTRLLYCYARLDWRVRPIVIMVKLWAQANNINDAKNMTVSSYSWALMVIHYLQCGVTPPVLPCLHGLIPEKFSDHESHSMDVQEEISSIRDFKSDNIMSLGELLIGFFQYYSLYNFQQYAISVRTGSSLPIDECRYLKAPKNDPHQWKYLCIEEPFDLTNTARSVFDLESFKLIKTIITLSYEELATSKMLNNILPVSLKHEIR
nr:poly(A) RNA polymerase gld-2 homolog A-like [Leptinotarsa decemlineata]